MARLISGLSSGSARANQMVKAPVMMARIPKDHKKQVVGEDRGGQDDQDPDDEERQAGKSIDPALDTGFGCKDVLDATQTDDDRPDPEEVFCQDIEETRCEPDKHGKENPEGTKYQEDKTVDP